jgi:hypothetical protein
MKDHPTSIIRKCLGGADPQIVCEEGRLYAVRLLPTSTRTVLCIRLIENIFAPPTEVVSEIDAGNTKEIWLITLEYGHACSDGNTYWPSCIAERRKKLIWNDSFYYFSDTLMCRISICMRATANDVLFSAMQKTYRRKYHPTNRRIPMST